MAFGIFVLSLVWFFVMYKLYGGFLSRRVFKLDDSRATPAHELRDDVDYVPTNKWVVWGHHFTSIAGLGPIVGPAIGIIWGWVPAVLWVTLGTVFLGAVHDFSALVISLRNKGMSIGEITTRIIGKRAKYLFMGIIFLELWVVIAIFAMIMGVLFKMYPSSVFPVWMEIPIAITLSYMVFKRRKSLELWSWIALLTMYVTVAIGVFIPVEIPGKQAVVIWLVILMIYAYIASTLPVETLLQPRDYINSHELLVAMFLIFLGAVATFIRDPGHLGFAAPAFNSSPSGAPPIWPFLFVTIACGAISGFHSLVASGTSSKQADKESDSKLIGYGGMIAEGILASLVILAAAAGFGAIGKGLNAGTASWAEHYRDWAAASGLGAKIGAFVVGAANMLGYVFGHSKYVRELMMTIMGVFIVSFAGTTLDTATRAQRYIIQEFGRSVRWRWLTGKHIATIIAVASAFALAMVKPGGQGALILWPLFGTINQLLAGLALTVATLYLSFRKAKPWVTGIPMTFMIFMTGWAMVKNIQKFYHTHNWLLFCIGWMVFALMVWMVAEAAITLTRGVKKKVEWE
ncbi:TPA: carbon starvation protein A [Candidatus Poribacteria bacterium]|nr:carbon starvation protein A [Candidatus Poribacteria bacterium]